MKKTVIITVIIVVLTSAGLIAFVNLTSRNTAEESNFSEVLRGSFEISVTGTGELIAERYTDVMGPNVIDNFNFRAAPLRITDIVPEGTIVKKGDYIATIDRSTFSNTLKDEQNVLSGLESEYELKLIDTAVVLSTLRDDIRNQAYEVEEAALNVEQAVYDPPAVQRQAEMEYDRMKRYLEQKQRIYFLRLAQSYSETKTMLFNLDLQRKKVRDLGVVLASFTVKAPSDGLVMYKKDRLGNKIKSGSMVFPFNPVVATIPDLSSMVSRTWVSEIEINKVSPGMPVKVRVDALEGKTMEGIVASVANVGEQLPNSDSKVFEVLIRLDENMHTLRPAMTSDNKIITRSYDDVVFVPLEALHTGSDNITFVYTRDGYRQVVIPGESNDKYVIIEKGVEGGRPIYLEVPGKTEKFRLAGNELVPQIINRTQANAGPGNGGETISSSTYSEN